MLERIQHMLIKEFIQIFRDPRMRMLIFLMPVIQLLIFGYAVTTDVKHIAIAVVDLDQSQASRDLVSHFTASRYFTALRYARDEHDVREWLDRGTVQAVLCFHKGFENDLRAGRAAGLQVLLDGTDSNTAGIILNYCNEITGAYAQQVLGQRGMRRPGAAAARLPVDLATRAWFNANLESRNYYVPGVIATIVTLITLLLTSMAVVREKELGTMEQIMVTPITRTEFILGKTAPFALVAFLDVILIAVVGVCWFDVPIRGSLWLLFAATALYLMTTLGLGLLISTVSQTQQQAVMTTFFFFFPAILLSGFMFPIANMPVIVQWLTYLNPLRYFLVIIRGIFLKGIGFSILWPQMAALAVIGILMLATATRRFHKTMQ